MNEHKSELPVLYAAAESHDDVYELADGNKIIYDGIAGKIYLGAGEYSEDKLDTREFSAFVIDTSTNKVAAYFFKKDDDSIVEPAEMNSYGLLSITDNLAENTSYESTGQQLKQSDVIKLCSLSSQYQVLDTAREMNKYLKETDTSCSNVTGTSEINERLYAPNSYAERDSNQDWLIPFYEYAAYTDSVAAENKAKVSYMFGGDSALSSSALTGFGNWDEKTQVSIKVGSEFCGSCGHLNIGTYAGNKNYQYTLNTADTHAYRTHAHDFTVSSIKIAKNVVIDKVNHHK